MIEIEAVVELQLPVSGIGVIGAARHQLHPVTPLIHHQIKKFFRIAQVIRQRGYIGIQADKQQPGIAVEARHGQEVVVAGIKGIRIATGLAILDVEILAG